MRMWGSTWKFDVLYILYLTKYEASSNSHAALFIAVGYIQIFTFIMNPNFQDWELEHWMYLSPIGPRCKVGF